MFEAWRGLDGGNAVEFQTKKVFALYVEGLERNALLLAASNQSNY